MRLEDQELVAVDPGLHQCGVAVWHKNRLVWADLVKNPDSIPGQGALCAGGMGEAVATAVAAVRAAVGYKGLGHLAIEVPQVYARGRGGDPNDLIDLACVVGSVMHAMQCPATAYRPAQWKGQVPKDISHARARAALTAPEVACVGPGCAPSLLHNVWDAVALGLAHRKRMAVLR